MEKDPKKLSFKPTFILLGIITFIVLVLFFSLSFFSTIRKEAVRDKYTKETQTWIAKNRPALTNIFTNGFPKECSVSQHNTSCPNGANVASKLSSDIKDYSSILFAKKVNGNIILMRLSGETYIELYPDTSMTGKFQPMLDGKTDILPWDDYTYQLQGQEVLVPFKDKNGKTLGIIVRGVIEKQ